MVMAKSILEMVHQKLALEAAERGVSMIGYEQELVVVSSSILQILDEDADLNQKSEF